MAFVVLWLDKAGAFKHIKICRGFFCTVIKQEGCTLMKERSYLAIDLKSFYASVECIERGLDPLDTNLVVADERRTDKTVCLAVTPSLKEYGISGRSRLFEVKSRIAEVNSGRRHDAPKRMLRGSSCFSSELRLDPSLMIDFIIAPPRMAYYMEYSTRIYEVYMKYIAPEDIIVYSIDEVFMDVTDYLPAYGLTAKELAMTIILDVLGSTGITATAGIGTNLYLCKIAMDIMAKHIPADKNGVRIAMLDEASYRRELWSHQPLTDFWRVGKGYAKKLEENGIFTMGDVARCSIDNEDRLYSLFGKNAELLIDHAWGWEPCTVEAVKAYRPASSSLSTGQILHQPYESDKARLVLREMADSLSMELLEKGLLTDQLVLTISYDALNLTDSERKSEYSGEIISDRYGRSIPKHSHGTANLNEHSSSSKIITECAAGLFDDIVQKKLLIRKLSISANHVIKESSYKKKEDFTQLDMFTDYEALIRSEARKKAELEKEKIMRRAVLRIKKRFGKNSILKGISLEEGATARDRNEQIGGHKA